MKTIFRLDVIRFFCPAFKSYGVQNLKKFLGYTYTLPKRRRMPLPAQTGFQLDSHGTEIPQCIPAPDTGTISISVGLLIHRPALYDEPE